jgi:hypothetical protein
MSSKLTFDERLEKKISAKTARDELNNEFLTNRQYKLDLFETSAELFKPITQSNEPIKKGIEEIKKGVAKSPLQKIIDDALENQNDRTFGLFSVGEEKAYKFGFTIHALGEFTYFENSPDNFIQDYVIRVNEEGIVVRVKNRLLPEWIEEKFEVTKNLMTLLTRNELIKDDPAAKKQYMQIIDFTLKDALNYMRTTFNQSLLNDVKSNVKFMNWIAPNYNIPTRKSERIKSENKVRSGKGTRSIILSPFADENKRRLYVILASKEAGNNSGLEEFTAILDLLMKNKNIDMKDYKRLFKRFISK